VEQVIDALLGSAEPSVRWKVRTQVLDEPADSSGIVALRAEIRQSPRARALVAAARGQTSDRVYDKWLGAHWALAALADLGSQQGNALWYLITLGLADGRTGGLAERLLLWQWPDGGWNCDRRPGASKSSFYETLLPMRGLAAHGLKAMAALDLLGDPRCAAALDLLESLRVADGWPAHRRHYQASRYRDHVDWGGTSARRANEWVTADALAVLHAAGRI
jgi:hypothetical protein